MSHKLARARRRQNPSRRETVVALGASASPLDARWIAFALIGVVLFACLPAITGGFLWDDDAHVTRPDLRSLQGLGRIWFELGATQQYYPLLHTAFWIEHRLWGDAVVGYHLVNILLHGVSAFLFLLILRRLTVPGSALAAALFALHPVHVESVAWITEQKNTLSLAFYLCAMYLYLQFDEQRRAPVYVLASGFFLLGLLTKTVVATLPAALLVIFWWRRGRLSWRRDVLPLTPWFAIGATAGLLTAWIEQRLLGAEGADFHLSLLQRTVLAGRIVWFYLGKLLWPADLAFIYPRWVIDASAWPQYLFTLAALAVLAGSWMIRGRSRAPLAVSLLFVGSLFPVLGFLNVFPFVFSFVADHFLYLPSLAIIAATSAGATMFMQRQKEGAQRIGVWSSVVLLGALGTLTWRQSQLYGDSVTLYEATLARNPACYLCLNNLGTLSFEAGELEQATEDFKAALRIKPDSAEARSNLGNVLVSSGLLADGIAEYRLALTGAPNNVSTRTNLGSALYLLGRIPEAKAELETALHIMPGYAPARQKLSVLEAVQQGIEPTN